MKEKTISIKLTKLELAILKRLVGMQDEWEPGVKNVKDKLHDACFDYERKFNESVDGGWWR